MKTAAFAIALATLLGACASGPERSDDDAGASDGGSGATLEVENRTGETLTVSVRGRTEGTVHAGTRLRMRHLLAGPAEVSALARGGDKAGAFSAAARVRLRNGAREVWTVMPDAAGGEPLPAVPELGALLVENPTQKSVTVTVSGRPLGRVFPGQARRFDDLAPGVLAIVAHPDDGSTTVEREVELAPGGESRWRFQESGAELRIANTTDEAIEVSIDGEARGRVAPGATWTSFEAPGPRVVAARSEPSRRPFEAVLELTPEAPTTWTVVAGQAALVVENGTGERLKVEVPDRFPVELAPREKARFDDLASGPVEVRAQGERLAYATRLELLPAQTVTWIAGPVAGSIRVENRTERVITLYTNVGGREEARGAIEPGAVVLLRDLPRTGIALSAIARGVARRQATTIDLSETLAATWVVSNVSGAVRVTNQREEALEVYVDARRMGDVPGRSERTFTGVDVGKRLVECLGKKTGVGQKDELSISEEVLASVTVGDITAWVEVDNQSGEAVQPRGALAEQAERIPAGGALRFKVRAGAQRLVVAGESSGLVFAHALEAPAGETTRWIVKSEPGRLLLWSRLDETVAVTVDDRARGSLPPDETLVLPDISPGRHRVQVIGLRSGIVRTEELRVAPGADSRVTFALELGVLLVENRSQEKVEVSIDGALFGEVTGGTVHAFGKVPPGKRDIELYFVKSHRVQRHTLEVREGQRARVVAEAPLGVLVVDNRSQQAVRVKIDGQTMATVPADAGPTLVNAPAGQRLVQIERLGDRGQLGFELEVRADSAIHLPVPKKSVRLVVVNRTDAPLVLFADEHRIAEVGARASEMFEELAGGEVRLMAKDETGRITHEERRRLHGGETATWVLERP